MLSDKQKAWKAAHRITVESCEHESGGGVRQLFGTTGVSRVQCPAGVWFEVAGDEFETLAEALTAYGVE